MYLGLAQLVSLRRSYCHCRCPCCFTLNRQRNVGDEHHKLGYKLYQQQKYQAAEELLQKAVQGQEKVLGKEHSETLNSKYCLALILHQQQKYQKAEELLREAVQGEEQIIGREHSNTLSSKYLT